MIIVRILLLPFAALFKLVTSIRNKLFDIGLKPSVAFDLPVIGVGNLTIGGTGKSPMVEHIIRSLITKNFNIATLSRGYGRKTKGMRVANSLDSALTVGDEPFQFYKKFSEHVTVVVGEDRAYGIPNIIHQFPETNVIILDDAYQHRYVRPSFNILLTDFSRPFYEDYLLPAGRLRESRAGAKRADVVIVTKCPSGISDDKMMAIEQKIKKYTGKRVFFTKIRYTFPIAFSKTKGSISTSVILVSGIANAEPFEEYAKTNFTLINHLRYGDHHHYTASDLTDILKLVQSNPGVSVLTTEKDMVKIDVNEFSGITEQISLFYLPIETEFIKNGEDFDEMVFSASTPANDK